MKAQRLIAIDLLGGDVATADSTRRTVIRHVVGWIRVSTLLTCISLAVYGLRLRTLRADFVARAVAKEAQLTGSAGTAKRLETLRQQHAALIVEAAARSRILTFRKSTAELLEAVSRSVTEGLWLTEIHRSDLEVRLEGRADSLASVASLARNLAANFGLAAPVEVRSVLADADAFRFQIVGKLAAPATEVRP